MMKKTLIALTMMGLSTGAMADFDRFTDFNKFDINFQKPASGIKKVILDCEVDFKKFFKDLKWKKEHYSKTSIPPYNDPMYWIYVKNNSYPTNGFHYEEEGELSGTATIRFELEFGNIENLTGVINPGKHGRDNWGYYFEDTSDNEIEMMFKVGLPRAYHRREAVHLVKIDRGTLKGDIVLFQSYIQEERKIYFIRPEYKSVWPTSDFHDEIHKQSWILNETIPISIDCKVIKEQENKI